MELLDDCPEDLRDWEWYYLMRLSRIEPSLVLANETEVNAGLAFSPDGRLLASAGEDGCVKIWNSRTGVVSRWSSRGHTGRVVRVAFHPDGCHLASAGEDHTVKVWDVTAGGREVFRRLEQATRAAVRGLAFSPDGRHLASAGEDKQVVAVGLPRPARSLRTFPGEFSAFTYLNVAFSPDGRWLAAGSWRRHREDLGLETGQRCFTPSRAPGASRQRGVQPRRPAPGRRGAGRMAVKVWDPTTERGEPLRTFLGHHAMRVVGGVQPGRPAAGLGRRGRRP